MKHIFEGTGVALVTPFTPSGEVDIQALTAIVHHVSQEGGVDYLVACGSTGEAATLNQEEKDLVLATVLEANAGKLPVLLGIGGNDTRALLERIKAQSFEGVAGLLSQSPHYNKPSQAGIVAHFQAIADVCPVPVMLYNVPGRTASNMSVQTTLKLAGHPNILAIKEASGSVEQVSEIARMAPEGFIVVSGDDPLTLPMIVVGARGLVSVSANVRPVLTSTIVRAAMNGDWEGCLAAHRALAPLIPALFEEGNPTGIKAALALEGLCTPHVRMPLMQASSELAAKLATLLETVRD